MGFVAIANTAKVEILGHNTDSLVPIATIMHITCGATPTQSLLAEYAEAINDAYNDSSINVAYPNNYNRDNVTVTDLNSVSGPQAVDTGASGVGGADAMTAPQACALLKLTTAKRGRSYRGRVYFPIPGDVLTTGDGNVSSGQITHILAWYDAMASNLAGASTASSFVVASRKLGTSQVVTGRAVEPTVATQRRRVGR
jgi:hypothetical protein